MAPHCPGVLLPWGAGCLCSGRDERGNRVSCRCRRKEIAVLGETSGSNARALLAYAHRRHAWPHTEAWPYSSTCRASWIILDSVLNSWFEHELVNFRSKKLNKSVASVSAKDVSICWNALLNLSSCHIKYNLHSLKVKAVGIIFLLICVTISISFSVLWNPKQAFSL